MAFFTKYIFNLFPRAIRQSDSYKWADGRGFLERYLSGFEDELDAELLAYVDNFMELFNVLATDSKYLPLIAQALGSPAQVDTSVATYRKVLEYAVALWRIKGTKRSYELLFSFIGLEVDIIEEPLLEAITYDMPGLTYDDSYTYDQGYTWQGGYRIAYNEAANPLNTNVSSDVLNRMAIVIKQIEPINAKFLGFVKRILIKETIDLGIAESYSIS